MRNWAITMLPVGSAAGNLRPQLSSVIGRGSMFVLITGNRVSPKTLCGEWQMIKSPLGPKMSLTRLSYSAYLTGGPARLVYLSEAAG